jgi:hypothetical protein
MTTKPLLTQIWASRTCLIAPTREITSGKLLVGILDGTVDKNTYLMSGKFNFSTYDIDDDFIITRSSDNDVGSGYSVNEPMLWHDDAGALHSTIRYDINGDCSTMNICRLKTSADDGASNWPSTVYDPGGDWSHHGAWMRAFVFQGFTWWQGRHGEAAPASSDQTKWTTFVRKAERTPTAGHKIQVIADREWFSVNETGNGDLDARSSGTAAAYLDYGAAIGKTAWYYRLQMEGWTPGGSLGFGDNF